MTILHISLHFSLFLLNFENYIPYPPLSLSPHLSKSLSIDQKFINIHKNDNSIKEKFLALFFSL